MAEISVVVPVYKVEKYLMRCIKSITSQSFTDLEIILVDDGSPDQCPAICDQLATQDPRIVVLHKKNGGLSSARNAGMKAATGKYIGFVDSDDTIDENMYFHMYELITKYQVSFVMSDYIRVLSNGRRCLKSLAMPGGLYDRRKIEKEIFPQLIMGKNVDYGPLLSVWHCLYDLNFLRKNHITFDEDVRWSEDNIFSAFVGYFATSFYYLKGKGLYNYYQNPGTITTSYRKGAWPVYKTMNQHLKKFFIDKNSGNFSNQLYLHLIYYACNCIGQAARLPVRERVEQIKKILNDCDLKEAFTRVEFGNIDIKLKIQLALMKFRSSRMLSLLIGRRK